VRKKLALLAGAAVVATLAIAIAVAPDANAAPVTVNWSATGALSDAATSATPAMTTCNGFTYMVWKGVGNDTRLFFSTSSTPGVWAPQKVVGGGGGTNTAPTVACDWNNNIVVAWKGLGNDEHIYYTDAEVESNRDQPPDLVWAFQKQVDGGALTDLTPSLAVLRGGFDAGTLYLAWRGAGGDTSVHYATLPGFTSAWQQLGTVPGVSTVRSPTLTDGLTAPFASPTLSLIWPLAGGQNIYSTTYLGGSSWTNPTPIVGGSGAAPAATEGPADGYNAPDNLVAWQGSGTDTRIYYTVNQNRSGWQPQQLVANGGPTTAGLTAADNVQCPNGHCTLITAYLAWRGPQSQVEFVYGAY
jgi:hypothetical protein